MEKSGERSAGFSSDPGNLLLKSMRSDKNIKGHKHLSGYAMKMVETVLETSYFRHHTFCFEKFGYRLVTIWGTTR